jgi:hypothetical protein
MSAGAGEVEGLDPSVPPSGTGCADCEAANPPGWWFHLRRCAQCGRVGCCDSSPAQHAREHYQATGHKLVQSYEQDEDWFYDFDSGRMFLGPKLAGPTEHPEDQPVPGPRGRVPTDWRQRLHP